ncbi:hypothetical protein FKW77_007646 [Venturia effusa]|uniref:Uncharacterized protein n=1 Tax=Venturia effusa TaxID=50376 RepID=A0A517LB93_9PEZI|nr:hypothetical protein FKW77_007646 [Venturia effusa]
MSDEPAPSALNATRAPGNTTRRPRNRHRSRGGRANTEHGASVAGPPLLPATVTPNIESSNQASNGRGGGGRRRGGRGRGGEQSGDLRSQAARAVPGGRRFGGQLTTGDDDSSSQSGTPQLYAGASEFVPGQPVVIPPRGPKARAPLQPRKRRMSKSTAPDIGTRIHEDVDNGNYECAVCTNEIYRNSKIWSCRTCWSIFHLSCIKKWSSSEGSAMARAQAEDGIPFRRRSPAGVKKRQNQDLYLVFHLSVVARLALVGTCCQKSVRTAAPMSVMLENVSLARRWALSKVVSVVVNLPHAAVLTRITRMVGHAVQYVESSCLAVNIFAADFVTKACAAPVKSQLKLDATAARWKTKSSVPIRPMYEQAGNGLIYTTTRMPRRNGLAYLAADTIAIVCLIAGSIIAKSVVILKML